MHALFVLVDDLGYADVSYHGASVGATISTPTIDALSADGVRLESYYVQQLCSPSRSSLLSGRYAYTVGMDGEVIVDGHPSCLPLGVSTIADRLRAAGWATAAYGKWDLGMTAWGCTPLCRGFDHFFGFYNAYNDYYTHVPPAAQLGLDLRNGTTPVRSLNGTYLTDALTAEHVRWLRAAHARAPSQPTFAYFAHEAVHGPLEVDRAYLERAGCDKVPHTSPARALYCGMMVTVDDSLAKVTSAYRELGLWESTLLIFSTDNGGDTDVGASNAPLRGMKGTTFEGGVRGVGWVGGGWPALRRRVTSTALMHISDWYPTIVNGFAGLPVGVPEDGQPPLDGISAWDVLTSSGAPSRRTEILHQLNPFDGQGLPPSPNAPGQGALRQGRWKLLHGHTCIWGQRTPLYGCDSCAARDGKVQQGYPAAHQPLPITTATSPPMCPNGWSPPPESGAVPIPPPDGAGVECDSLPCFYPNSTLITGGTLLFDIESDPTEQQDVSASHPEIVARMLARLGEFNASGIPQLSFPYDPASDPASHGGVWTPWQGSAEPSACAPPEPPSPSSDIDGLRLDDDACGVRGWCSQPGFRGPPLRVRVLLDGSEAANATADLPREKAGPHGFDVPLDCARLRAPGRHTVRVQAFYMARWAELNDSPICVADGKAAPCASA